MSGRMSGEVWTLAKHLRAAGATQRAVNVLAVVAERCYDSNRAGPCSRAHIAEAQDVTERTVTRALTLLLTLGLITVVSAGGGRGRHGLVTIYEVPDLHAWVAARRRDAAAGSAGHLGVPPDPVPEPAPTAPTDDPGDTGDPSARHPGVARSVVPVENSLLEPEVTTPRAIERPPGWRPSPRPRATPLTSSRPRTTPGLAVLCPRCAEPAGRPCVEPIAGRPRRTAPHWQRHAAAVDTSPHGLTTEQSAA